MTDELATFIDEATERVIDQICMESDLTIEILNSNQRLRRSIRDELCRVAIEANRND